MKVRVIIAVRVRTNVRIGVRIDIKVGPRVNLKISAGVEMGGLKVRLKPKIRVIVGIRVG